MTLRCEDSHRFSGLVVGPILRVSLDYWYCTYRSVCFASDLVIFFLF
jgi:hypothetical protein